jgi:hypothetical protein
MVNGEIFIGSFKSFRDGRRAAAWTFEEVVETRIPLSAFKAFGIEADGEDELRLNSQLSMLQIGSFEQPSRYLTDEEIAIELTQAVAIATADRFVVLTHRPIKEREIH